MMFSRYFFPTAFVAPVDDCADRDNQCIFLLRSFYCGQDPLVNRICPDSCGLCGNSGVNPGNVSTVTDAPGSTNISSPGGLNDTCMDYDLECPYLLDFCMRKDLLVNRLCRQSCNLCGVELETPVPAVTTPKPAPPVTSMKPAAPVTLPPLQPYKPPAGAECRDTDLQCAFLLQSFYCDVDKLVARVCPYSCGLCGPGGNDTGSQVTGPPAVPDVCMDFDDQCPELLAFCQDDTVLVNRLCKKSCNTCGIDTTAPPPAIPSLDPYVIPAVCVDLADNCPDIVVKNSCFSNPLVSRVCPVTCGLCNETKVNTTTGGPATGVVCKDYDPECSTLQNACGVLGLVDNLCPLTCAVCKGPLKCRVCSDPLCDEFEAVHQCTSDAPYCLNTVVNDANGNKHISKRCGSTTDCDTLWLAQSSVDTTCQYYDLNSIYQRNFTCHYCCVENNCNNRVVPLPTTQYRLP
ncbi:uncharacterized protein LOC101858060 [Aplysia californica]|uniref:Uncharacterized protein LOC101858060 n=1 Tax=Aplysia californica TaxID=6500 RepID=A0ABM1W0N1_APLCA|nr:uncharacterized protein LOC101858060 [Aplysia californica]